MNVLVLNGSPRKNGSTAKLVNSFVKSCKIQNNMVEVVNVCQNKIAGCIACEYCHNESDGECIQKDDMQKIYPLLQKAEMLVIASPIYYYGFTGQLQCAISRIYAIDKPEKLKKGALILCSEDSSAYEGAIYAYQKAFIEYLKLEDLGIFTVSEEEKKLDEKSIEIYEFAKKIIKIIWRYLLC